MSYQIITRITITPDLRVMVRMAANNIRPLDFRYDEVVSLTETLRTKGRPTLELELLSLFFKGLWQGRTRYDRAVGYTLLTEKLPERRGVLIQGMFRSNYVIMGIPVATALLGADQLGTVSILIAVIVPLFNMLAVVVLEVFRGQKPKPLHILGQIAKNPLVIGSVLGILTLVAGIRLPHILEQTIQSVSAIASPLQLFLLGAFFQFSGLKTYHRELVTVSIAKLIVSPGLFLGLGALLGFRGVAFVSLIGIFASPTAVNSFTMAQQMGGDAELAGDIVVTTSAASILTMFFWIFLFKSLGMF